MTDPYRLLGVPEAADDDTIRAAYLAAVRACPPERDSQRFEQVRAAFEAIATEPQRRAHALFDTSAPTVRELLDILSAQWQTRPTAGPPRGGTAPLGGSEPREAGSVGACLPTEDALYRVLGRHDGR